MKEQPTWYAKFNRNPTPRSSLGVGIIPQLPKLMGGTGYDYTDYYEVWLWALQYSKYPLFSLIVSLEGKDWFGKKIQIGGSGGNGILWESIAEGCYEAVKAVLSIPNLFHKKTFNLDPGTSIIRYEKRGSRNVGVRQTNFGAFLNLARNNGYRTIEKLLLKYYRCNQCGIK